MTLVELTAQLVKVQAAIDAVLLSQSYSIGGKNLTRANLADLQKERSRIELAIDRLGNGSCSRTPVFSTREDE